MNNLDRLEDARRRIIDLLDPLTWPWDWSEVVKELRYVFNDIDETLKDYYKTLEALSK